MNTRAKQDGLLVVAFVLAVAAVIGMIAIRPNRMPAIGSIVTFEASPLESGVRVTEGRVHKTDGRYVHIRPLLNGVEQAEFWKLTPCEILRVKEGK